MQHRHRMRSVVLALGLVGCTFPTPSEDYTCAVDSDCTTGRVCRTGYCVVGSNATPTPDAPPAPPVDAPPIPPDADPFVAIAAQCQAQGYTLQSGGYYRVVTTSATWVNAQTDCANDVPGATHLIVLSSTAEVTFAATNPGWIGLSDRATEGTFVNVTNEPNDQRPWAAGQPDNGGGNENCVHIGSGGRLNDDQCGNDKRYTCECDGRMPVP